jgi:hypothetical protein
MSYESEALVLTPNRAMVIFGRFPLFRYSLRDFEKGKHSAGVVPHEKIVPLFENGIAICVVLEELWECAPSSEVSAIVTMNEQYNLFIIGFRPLEQCPLLIGEIVKG